MKALTKINGIESSVSFLNTIQPSSESCQVEIRKLTSSANNSRSSKKEPWRPRAVYSPWMLRNKRSPIKAIEDTNEIVRQVGHLVDIDIDDKIYWLATDYRHRTDQRIKTRRSSYASFDVIWETCYSRQDLNSKIKQHETLVSRGLHPKKIFISESLTKRNKVPWINVWRKRKNWRPNTPWFTDDLRKLVYKFIIKYIKVVLHGIKPPRRS